MTLLAIADWARDDGTRAYPTIKMLAQKTRLSERSIQRIIQHLEGENEVRIVRSTGRGRAHEYTVLMGKGDILSPDRDDASLKGDTDGQERVTSVAIKGDTGGVSTVNTQPSLQPLDIQAPLDPSVWPDWYSDLYSIKSFKKPLADCRAWLVKEHISEAQANVTAADVKGKWPGNPKRPYTDVWAVFRGWVKRPPLPGNGRPSRPAGDRDTAELKAGWNVGESS